MKHAKQTALAPWFGGKRTLAVKIVPVMGDHSVYWEPFCGSMAVLFRKPKAKMETVNDLHEDLINLARVLKDRAKAIELYDKLQRTLFAESLFRDSLGYMHSTHGKPRDPEEWAYHYFVTSWMGMGGIAGTDRIGSSFCRRFSSNGGNPGVRFAGAVDSVPEWHERLREVIILSEDGIGLCRNIEDKKGTVIYCDPPYFASTREGGSYRHDFQATSKNEGLFEEAEQDKHVLLAEALQRFKHTRVAVSYYDCPELDQLYPEWTKTNLVMDKKLVRGGMKIPGRVDAAEVLLTNWRIDVGNVHDG